MRDHGVRTRSARARHPACSSPAGGRQRAAPGAGPSISARSGGPRKLSTCSLRAAPPAWEFAHDPALALLGARWPRTWTRRAPGRGRAPGWPGRAERAAAWRALSGSPSRGAAAWLRAAAAGGLVAGLASVTSLIATSMLARLARGPVRVGRWDQRRGSRRRGSEPAATVQADGGQADGGQADGGRPDGGHPDGWASRHGTPLDWW